MSGIATSDKLAHELGRSAENEERRPQDKLNHQPFDSVEARKQIGGDPIRIQDGKQMGVTSNKDLFPEPSKNHQRDSTDFPTDITPEITSENLNMDKPQRPSQLIQSEETQKQTESDSKEPAKDQTEENKEGRSGVTGWIETIKDTVNQTEQAGGLTGWIAGTVKGTVSTLLSPIANVMSTQKTQTDDQSKETNQEKQIEEKDNQNQTQESQNRSEPQQEETKEQSQSQSQQSQTSEPQTQGKPDSSLHILIGSGKSVQLIYGGRCIAASGKQVIVEKTAPSQSEQNTFTIELLKEDEDLVRIRHGDLFLTADRNVGMFMAPENSNKINSFHLEKNGDLFALRVHNEQRWVGVGLKTEKKDITQDQQGVELERDGQIFVEINKCYQFDIQSDHIWMRLSFL